MQYTFGTGPRALENLASLKTLGMAEICDIDEIAKSVHYLRNNSK